MSFLILNSLLSSNFNYLLIFTFHKAIESIVLIDFLNYDIFLTNFFNEYRKTLKIYIERIILFVDHC